MVSFPSLLCEQNWHPERKLTWVYMTALVALEAGCEQRPNTTDLLGLSGSVFSSSVINIVDPSTVNKTSAQSAVQLSTATVASIAAGSAALVIIVAAIAFICCRRRRNRANLGMEPRWGKTSNKHKRQSSFSFRCRNILASPISPKFFRDSPVDEQQQQHMQQPYGSLDEHMAATTASSGTVGSNQGGRYYIESKQSSLSRHPYETSLDGWSVQDVVVASPPQPDVVVDQWNTFRFPDEKGPRAKKQMAMTIDTGLAAPPPAHQSPKENVFEINHSRRPQQTTPTMQQQQYPIYDPTDRVKTTSPASYRSTSSSQVANSPSRGKPKTTTMSSQGSGYPKLKSPTWSSPLLRPGAIPNPSPSTRNNGGGGGGAEPWFPPPPPPGPPPSSSRYGRKVSGTAGSTSPRKGRRESGSPVESKQIQISFPGPPGR